MNGTLPVTLEAETVDAIAARVADLLGEQSAPPEPVSRQLAVGIGEAAELLGMSPDHFRRHVLPDLQIVRSGRLRLVPVVELKAWLERTAARAGALLAHGPRMPHEKRDRDRAQGKRPRASRRAEA